MSKLLFWVFDHAMDEGSRGIFQRVFKTWEHESLMHTGIICSESLI